MVKVLIFKKSRQISSCAAKRAFHALVKRANFAKTLLVSCQLESFPRSSPSADPLCRRRLRRPAPARRGAIFTPLSPACAGVLLTTYFFHPRRAKMMGVAAGESSGPDPIGRSCAAAAPLPGACAPMDRARQYFISTDLPGGCEHLPSMDVLHLCGLRVCLRVCVRGGCRCVCSCVSRRHRVGWS